MKTLPATLSFALATTAGCGGLPEDAAAPPEVKAAPQALISGTGYFQVEGIVESPRCIDPGYLVADGSPAFAWACTEGSLSQVFRITTTDGRSGTPEPGDRVTLRAFHSGKCLDVPGASMSDNVQLIQWPCAVSNNNNQRFDVERAVDGGLRFRAVHSGKCLTMGTGRGLVQYNCDTPSTATSSLRLLPVTNLPSPNPAGGTVTLYEHSYSGASATIAQDLSNLADYGWGKITSSLRHSPGAVATVYSEPNYGGRAEAVFFDTADLSPAYIGNDAISSIRMGAFVPTVVFFEHSNYGGARRTYNSSETDMQNSGFDNQVTSLRVVPGMTITGYSLPNYKGRCQTFTGSTASVSGGDLGNDALSSFRYGSYCDTRSLVVSNNSGIALRYRVKRDGEWGPWSSTLALGQTSDAPFTAGQTVWVDVDVWLFGGWADVCTKLIDDTSANRAFFVSGTALNLSCSVQ